MKTTDSRVKALKKDIYVAALHCIDPQFRGDTEAVKAKRDEVIWQEFKRKSFDELEYQEALYVLEELQCQSGFRRPEDRHTGKLVVTPRQLKNLYAFMLGAAARYYDFYELEWEVNGHTLKGPALKAWVRNQVEQKNNIPKSLFYNMLSNWANLKSNEFLHLNFNKRITDKNRGICYYNKLTQVEAQELLKYWGKMIGTTLAREGTAHINETAMVN